jgi:MoaA/NifB/PqqE/SkfB family radical SAM enzyme
MRKEDFRPRLIVWQLKEEQKNGNGSSGAGMPLFSDEFTAQECMLTIDSISRASKPILVLTGPGVVNFPELFDVVQYSFALGLKVIVEAKPDEISDELLLKFSRFGRRVFRVLIDGCIAEGTDSRYDQSAQFRSLEACVVRLRKAGYEVHFGMTLGAIQARQLAFIHDYAFRRSADGLYFHLDWTDAPLQLAAPEPEGDWSDRVIESIATIKQSSPRGMMFSPQCIRYARREQLNGENGDGSESGYAYPVRWCHSCVGGKTFAFINPEGKVQVCKELSAGNGDLRSNGYDFKAIWERSELLTDLRTRSQSCLQTRASLSEVHQ